MAGVKEGCVHLCWVAVNTVWSHMASDTPYLCHGMLLLTAIQCSYLYWVVEADCRGFTFRKFGLSTLMHRCWIVWTCSLCTEFRLLNVYCHCCIHFQLIKVSLHECITSVTLVLQLFISLPCSFVCDFCHCIAVLWELFLLTEFDK